MSEIVDVEVDDWGSADDIAEVLDGVRASDFAGLARVVDDADEVVDRDPGVLLGELLRGHRVVAVEGLLLVVPLPLNSRGRRAEVDRQDAVHDLERRKLGVVQLLGGRTVRLPAGAGRGRYAAAAG